MTETKRDRRLRRRRRRRSSTSTRRTVHLLLVAHLCASGALRCSTGGGGVPVFSHAFVAVGVRRHRHRHQRLSILPSAADDSAAEVYNDNDHATTSSDSTTIDASSCSADSAPTNSKATSATRRQQDRRNSSSRNNNNNNNPEAAETYRTNLKIAELAGLCGKSREPLNKRIDAALKAYQLLRQMKHPDTVAYNSVLKAFSKVSPCTLSRQSLQQQECDVSTTDGDDSAASTTAKTVTAAEHAERLVEEMKVVHRNQLEANQRWYDDLALDRLSDDEVSAGPPRVYVKPNVRSYSTVMDAYARARTRYAATKAQELLRELQQRYEDSDQQDGALEPNLISYNTCLAAWAKAGCCYECLQLFDRMPVRPDVISYNAVLHALARSRWNDAGIRAQKLLESMGDNDAVKPNGRSYTTTADAWSQCGRPDMAESLLKKQLELYDSTGDVSFRPNAVSYATVLHAYATSSSSGDNKAVKAFRLVQDMTKRGIGKNRVVWNNLLHCFATSRPGNPTTIELVRKLYRQVLDHSEPDHYTFGTVLKASSNLLVWKTDQSFAPSVFREACHRGQVSDGVLWQLRQAVPIDTYRELVGTGEININSIPLEWKRNVRGEGGQNHQQQRSNNNRRTRTMSSSTTSAGRRG